MIQLLNSGDALADSHVLQRVSDFMECNPQAQWISGKLVMTDPQGKKVERGIPFDPNRLNRGMDWVAHPTWWVNKSTDELLGPYDLSLKIAMDFDMMIRLRKTTYAFCPEVLVRFDTSGVSNKKFSEGLWEAYAVYKRHFGASPVLFFLQCRHIGVRFLGSTKLGGKLLSKWREFKMQKSGFKA